MNTDRESDLRKSIAEIEARAAPLRADRERINAEREQLALHARDLTRRINDVEDELERKRFEIKQILKRAGRLTTLPVGA
jgi:chromosome segregation ATPase